MPAASAWSTGALKASLSTTASAIPSALAEMAFLVALTISATIESLDPVHWNSQLSRAQASWAPYWVGVKNGLVVTWLTNTNFHLGVAGKSPEPVAAASLLLLSSLLVQAASSAEAASDALVRPTPPNRRRRVTRLRSSVSTACSTTGSTLDIATLLERNARSVGGEAVDGGGLVPLTRRQHGRREVGVVGRVGVVLGLEGEPVALPVHPAAGADQRPVQEVAGVELDARLVGDDLQDPAAPRLDDPGRQLEAAAVPVQHPVVVVAAPDDELLEPVADARPDGGRAPEVHRRAADPGDLAGRDQGRVNRRVVAGLEGQLVAVDVARALAGQVPVGVVGQVDDRLQVAVADQPGPVVHADLVAVGERVGDLVGQPPRVALVTVGAGEAEHQPHAVPVPHRGGGPHVLVEADRATVEAVGRVVDRQLVGLAVELEPAQGDAVGIAAGDAAEIRALGLVVGDVVEAEGDVGQAT